MAHRSHTLAGRLFFWGIVAFGVLTFTEALFRYVIFPEYRSLGEDLFERHPVIGYFNRPDMSVVSYSPGNYKTAIRTNSLGLRGAEQTMGADLSGVWVGGDSNTFAKGVAEEKTFVRRLAQYGYAAANISSEGHRLSQQALVARYLAKSHRPRAIVIGISLPQAIADYSNEFVNLTRPLTPDAGFAGIRMITPRSELRHAFSKAVDLFPRSLLALRARLMGSSAIYGWLKVGIGAVPWAVKTLRDSGLIADLELTVKGDLNLRRPFGPQNPMQAQVDSTADFAKAFQDWTRKTLNVPFGIVIYPTYHQMYPEHFRRYMKKFNLEGEDLIPIRSLDALRTALQARGVPVLDLLPALQSSGLAALTFPSNGHLNANAHAPVAKAVAHWLESDLGVPPVKAPR